MEVHISALGQLSKACQRKKNMAGKLTAAIITAANHSRSDTTCF